MPKWGLTEAQRDERPWGLDPKILEPAKTITDPLHGDIYVTKLERLFLDSPPMQRLRRVRQLGLSHMVYPGATHSRFSHAVGALRAAQDLLDAVVDNRLTPHHHTPDLFDEWDEAGNLDKCLAEATVLARLGALLHDLCHVPYGHTIEDDLKVLDEHDKNEPRFNSLWNRIPESTRSIIEAANDDLFGELKRLILSKREWTEQVVGPSGDVVSQDKESRYPFVADIVGNTICADLLDYIGRDHRSTGLPLEIGTRFMNDFYVQGSQHVLYKKRMVVQVTRGGHRRADIISELLKYLQYRYELSERVLVHHAKAAADAMMGKLLEIWYDAEWTDRVMEQHPELITSNPQLSEDIDGLRTALRSIDPEGPHRIYEDLKTYLEDEFSRRSDDSLLEALATHTGQLGPADRRRGMMFLAESLLDRSLFKLVGRAEGPSNRAHAETVYKNFGRPEPRRRLEQSAARFAGVKPRWKVVLWVPNPAMKLKVAGVLVDVNGWIGPLSKEEPSGDQIVQKHKHLWGVSVFASRDIREEEKVSQILGSYLGEKLGLTMVTSDGYALPAPRSLAVRRVAEAIRLTGQPRAEFEELVTAAKSTETTFDSLLTSAWETAVGRGWASSPRPDDL